MIGPMGILGFGRASEAETVTRAEYDSLAGVADVMRESIADLELALEDRGWESIDREGGKAFTREGLHKISTRCRTYAVANPLVKRGLAIRAGFIFGQGVTVNATANGKPEADGTTYQNVDAVIRAVWDDRANQRSVFSLQALERLERSHGTDGGVFLALWTSPLTGFVRPRSVPFDEVRDIITNPEDREDPWYYLREYDVRTVDTAGKVGSRKEWVAHPAEGFRPRQRPDFLLNLPGLPGEVPILWDAPMIHTKVNALDGWKFGIGDAYAALPWARMDRDYLRNWSVVMESLAQFTWQATPKGQASAKKSQALRAAMSRVKGPQVGTLGEDIPGAPGQANPASVGATAQGFDLTAIPKSGATIDANASKPFKSYVASALGVPVTQLTGDPGTTGARAVAETLDGPQQLDMGLRRAVWTDVFQRIAAHVIRSAVRAPRGALIGYIEVDDWTGQETAVLADDAPQSLDVSWPPFGDESTLDKVRALVEAASITDALPLEWLLRQLLEVLGAEDVDELLDAMRDEDGTIRDPRTTAGEQAVQAFRRGDDPAETLR